MITERRTNRPEHLQSLFLHSSFEMSPKRSLVEKISAFSEDTKFSIVSAHKKGVDTTLDFLDILKEQQRIAIPHIAARGVRSKKHVLEIADRISGLHIKEIFLLGGDNEIPTGNYDCTADFMYDFLKVNKSVEKIRITGYPEGHPIIASPSLNYHVMRKLEIAKSFGIGISISTQICYDPELISLWIGKLSEKIGNIKFNIGTPVPTSYPRLMKYSLYSGVVPSISFIQKLGMEKALNLANFDTRGFIEAISKTDNFSQVCSFHFFTFDDLGSAITLKESFVRS